MNRTPQQKAYAADLKLLSDDSLFAKLRAAMEQLRAGGRFSDADGSLMWQSMALESEVIDVITHPLFDDAEGRGSDRV